MIDWNEYPQVKELLDSLHAKIVHEEAKMLERRDRILAGPAGGDRDFLSEEYERFTRAVLPLRAHIDHLIQQVVAVEAMKPPRPFSVVGEDAVDLNPALDKLMQEVRRA